MIFDRGRDARCCAWQKAAATFLISSLIHRRSIAGRCDRAHWESFGAPSHADHVSCLAFRAARQIAPEQKSGVKRVNALIAMEGGINCLRITIT